MSEPIERGRYALFPGQDELVIVRAIDICDTCSGCGCGTQQDPITLPDFRQGQASVMGWMMKNVTKGNSLMGTLKGLMANAPKR